MPQPHRLGRIARRVAATIAALSVMSVIGPVAAGQPGSKSPSAARPDVRRIAGSPLAFEEIRDRPGTKARFESRGPRHTLTLEPTGATLKLGAATGRPERALRISMAGASRTRQLSGMDPLPGRIYHATSHSLGALTGRASYRRVKSSAVYPGIDLVYYGNDRQLEFDLVAAPNADTQHIRLAFGGADSMTLTSGGELAFRIGSDEVRLKKPSIYQIRDGARAAVAGSYRIVDRRARQVAIQVAGYDRSRPLVIDPAIVFATYRGGAAVENARQIKVNSIGETYLFADTQDPALPGVTHHLSLAPPRAGFAQCFLTKISQDGSAALYTVIFDGAGCQAMDIAPDGASPTPKVHVQVGTSFHYQRTLTENADGSLTVDLLQRAYDACLAGPCGPALAMRADAAGNVYFIMQYTPDGMSPPDFVYELRKIDAQGRLAGAIRLMQPHIYPGSQVFDTIAGLEVDKTGKAYVLATVASAGILTTTLDAFQQIKPSGNVCTNPISGTCDDVVLLVVDDDPPNGLQFTYASYVGTSGDDRAVALATDPSSGLVYITGTTDSPVFPTTPGSFVAPPNPGAGGAFLIALDLTQSGAQQLAVGTFLSHGFAAPGAMTLLAGGMPAIVGEATDAACRCFPLVNSLYPARLGDQLRPFLSVFSADGSALPFSTFLDSTPGSGGFPAAVASNGSSAVYVGTTTNDPSLGTAGSLQPSIGGSYDALVQAIDATGVVPANDPPEIAFTPSTIDLTITAPGGTVIVPLVCGRLFACILDESDGDAITQLVWSGPNGFRAAASPGVLPAPAQPGVIPAAFASLGAGTYVFTLTARDERGGIGTGALTINVHAENTLPGSPQHVVLTDPRFMTDNDRPLGLEHPIELTFANVRTAGLTWLASRSDLTPAPPTGLQAGSPPYYYDVESNAGFDGTVNVCFDIGGASYARRQDELLIYRQAGASWVALDNQSHAVPSQVCGDTPTLGSFAIFYAQVPETAIATFAGTGCAQDSIDGFGGDPCDDFNESAQAAQSSLTRPGQLAVGGGQLYVADNGSPFGGRIRRIDLASGQISTVVPPGVCDGLGPLAYDSLTSSLYCTQLDTATNLRSIIRYDVFVQSFSTVVPSWPNAIGALALDGESNLFFTDESIYRVAATGGSPQLIVSANSTPAPHHLPYVDRFTALAFDRQGSLLAGGQTLIRVVAGASGVVDGSPDETLTAIAGIPRANLTGYAEPFAGDGLPASQAMLAFSYQMTVTADGSVVFGDGISRRIRRIGPGADGVVNGGADEIVNTIAGYYGATPPNPSGFATSEGGDFRGIVEDPQAPASFFVSSQLAHTVEHFGIPGGTTNPPTDADVAVNVLGSAASIVEGQTLHYTITISNNGPAMATGVGMSLPVPAGLLVVNVTSPAGLCIVPFLGAAGTLSCDAGSIAPRGHAVIGVDVQPHAPGQLISTFTVGGQQPDPVTANNTAAVETEIAPGADVSIAVASPSSGSHVAFGAPMQIDVSISNLGPGLASTSQVRFEAPAGLANLNGSTPLGTCVASPGLVVCNIDNFAPNSTQHVTVSAVPTAFGPIAATFTISAPLADPFPANNTTTLNVVGDLIVDESIRVNDRPGILGSGTSVSNDAIQIAETVRVDDRISIPGSGSTASDDAIQIAETVHVDDKPRFPGLITNGHIDNPASDPQGNDTGVTVQFASVEQAGFLTATPMNEPPPPPPGFAFVSPVFDVSTTVVSSGPIIVCVARTDLVPGDMLAHFENAWVDRTAATLSSSIRLCAETTTLSPFAILRAINRPPTAGASAPPTVEVTSVSGASFTLNGSGSDPDAGDAISFRWSDGATTIGTAQSIVVTRPIGAYDFVLTVTDSHGAAATAAVHVVVRDTTAPIVTVPPSITVPATSASGATGATWAALAAFVGGGTAIDTGDAAPARLAPQVDGHDVTNGTLFAIGSTKTVTFRFRDASGNVGTAQSQVTVILGKPKIAVRIAGNGTLSGTKKWVDVELTNVGDGNARQLDVDLILSFASKGAGFVKLQSPLPVHVGDLDAGARTVTRVVLDVPATVKQLTLIEVGTLRNVKGAIAAYVELQLLAP